MIGRSEIGRLIPHAGDMCLLEEAMSWDADAIRCRATSHCVVANPLRLEGRLGAVCGVEYASQAMALHGALSGAIGGRPKAGFLVSLRALTLHVDRLDDLQDDLIIKARLLAGDAGGVSYRFSLEHAGRRVLEGRATVVLDAGEG